MQIDYLADHPEFIAPLAQGLLEHYRRLRPEDTIQTRTAKLRTHLQRDTLPIAWVAHVEEELLGTAALRVHDLEGREDLTPWLGGVFVLPPHRRRGIGQALCAVVEEKAASLGVSVLHLFTLDRQAWYTRQGWRPLAPCAWRGHPGHIMCKLLPSIIAHGMGPEMDLRLRPAGKEDHAFLQRLNREAYEELVRRQYGSWDDASQRARFARKLQSVQFRIVLLDNQPVGAVSSTEHDDHVFLNELLILPEFQNRGIGSRVLGGELRHADLLGKPIRLHTLRLNRAQELYRRHGFVEAGHDEHYVNMERAGSPDVTPSPRDAGPRVREAQSDEAGLLLDILLRAFSEYEGRLDPPSGVHAETTASVREKLKEGGALVCEVGGSVAGCVFYAPKAEYLYVGRLAVLPEYRRRGIGDMLLRASERRAGELGFGRVRLGVRVALGKLRAYYEARGYVPIAFRSHAGYTHATSVEMEKALAHGPPT